MRAGPNLSPNTGPRHRHRRTRRPSVSPPRPLPFYTDRSYFCHFVSYVPFSPDMCHFRSIAVHLTPVCLSAPAPTLLHRQVKEFPLPAKARIWPQLSHVCHICSTAVCSGILHPKNDTRHQKPEPRKHPMPVRLSTLPPHPLPFFFFMTLEPRI